MRLLRLNARPCLRHASSAARVAVTPPGCRAARARPCRVVASGETPAGGDSEPTTSAPAQPNPLEQLRTTRDPVARARLMQQLDGCWSDWSEQYIPTDVETYIVKELGIWKDTVMLAAVQNPELTAVNVLDQVKPAIRALKDANMDVHSIWFLITKSPHLLAMPVPLSRWIDFLSVYGLKPRELQNFLLRAPRSMLEGTTLFQAGAVVSLLKNLGISDEFLAARVLCVWPSVLARDVETELRPIITFAMSLGLEVVEIGRIVCAWPEVLLSSVDGQLRPFAEYLRGLGCSTEQVTQVLVRSPHLLGFKAGDVFGKVLRSLEQVGMGPDDVRAMLGHSAAFLISTGVQDTVDGMLEAGFTAQQVRQLALSCPEVLVVNANDLQRSMRFLRDEARSGVEGVLACPLLLTRGLATMVGPRVSFVLERPALRLRFAAGGGGGAEAGSPPSPPVAATTAAAEGSSAAAAAAAPEPPRLDFGRLLSQADDVQWCNDAGISVNEFRGFKKSWEDRYSEKLHQDSAAEFQEELKKLGIFEGR